jgi:NAD-dependent dihydropyrimidine dehydrogenase PreA subunit
MNNNKATESNMISAQPHSDRFNTDSGSNGLLVVVSQGQSRSPDKRALEEAIATVAATLPQTGSMLVPNLYDLANDSQSVSKMRQWQGPIVILSWLFDRAAFWVLDRNEIRGQFAESLLLNPDLQEDDDEDAEDSSDEDEKAADRVTSINVRPDRNIYSIDLRASTSPEAYAAEFRRILSLEKIEGPKKELLSLERFLSPTNSTAMSMNGSGNLDSSVPTAHESPLGIVPLRMEDHPARRWYPVIDYSRCTNCMECIDFCLFGVYGVDRGETILVEQPDNCRKGCPACSRVCPENAIMFPQHKTPAIAGAPVDAGGFKIDLSKLFGAPERDEDPAAAAARERNEQLILAGRAAVDTQPVPNPAKAMDLKTANANRDELDSLIDQLDQLDL